MQRCKTFVLLKELLKTGSCDPSVSKSCSLMGRREADGRSDVEKFRKNIGLSSFIH